MVTPESDDKIGAGILIRTLKKGTGTTHPRNGDYCLVHYEGFLEDGTLLDSSRARQQPLKVKVGARQVLEGLDIALLHLVEGQQVEVTIPHLYAYGELGYPPKIPPRSTLVFQIELLRITERDKS
jgi:FKBP-type peptidyl-prolyl cis-trans isomerase